MVQVIGGVDPHADTVYVAAVTAVGKVLGDAEFPTTPDGYGQACTFLTGWGEVARVGVEGAASYGAGISRALQRAGMVVVEVERPTRSARRRRGKSDQLDAYHAARSVLAERTSPVKDPALDGLRALLNAYRSAVKAQTAAMNQMKSILVTSAPEPIRAKFGGLKRPALAKALLACRTHYTDPVAADCLLGLKMLAERHRFLITQLEQLSARMDPLVTSINPALRAAAGVGPFVAAQLLITAGSNPDRLTSEGSFAALCGAAPVPASSGKTRCFRLARGGDRRANHALHQMVLVRLRHDPTTQAYKQRQLDRGRSKKAIMRQLKRAVAREMFIHLTRPEPVPAVDDLRPARQAKHLTLAVVADHFHVWPTVISRIERGLQRNDTLADQYRAWLAAA